MAEAALTAASAAARTSMGAGWAFLVPDGMEGGAATAPVRPPFAERFSEDEREIARAVFRQVGGSQALPAVKEARPSCFTWNAGSAGGRRARARLCGPGPSTRTFRPHLPSTVGRALPLANGPRRRGGSQDGQDAPPPRKPCFTWNAPASEAKPVPHSGVRTASKPLAGLGVVTGLVPRGTRAALLAPPQHTRAARRTEPRGPLKRSDRAAPPTRSTWNVAPSSLARRSDPGTPPSPACLAAVLLAPTAAPSERPPREASATRMPATRNHPPPRYAPYADGRPAMPHGKSSASCFTWNPSSPRTTSSPSQRRICGPIPLRHSAPSSRGLERPPLRHSATLSIGLGPRPSETPTRNEPATVKCPTALRAPTGSTSRRDAMAKFVRCAG